KIALVFTGDEFADGGEIISKTLEKQKIKASFFFTGNFYRNPGFKKVIIDLKRNKNYLSTHSDRHLLYCDWFNRDSLLVTRNEFTKDLQKSFSTMSSLGIIEKDAPFFLPPYEWYNDSISAWTKELGHQLINYSPGTLSNTDYTTPDLKNYRSSEEIYNSILHYEQSKSSGLNGFILLLHIGTDAKRTDKFYNHLPELIKYLKAKGYQFQTVEQLLYN
ncbi:MAG TPA: polysaccharide deacetylase family protein, partial [Chitinophagaceae bacterium]|nr:polysaccharide deacetylase family protein [Chitinophagaceae bacterium]